MKRKFETILWIVLALCFIIRAPIIGFGMTMFGWVLQLMLFVHYRIHIFCIRINSIAKISKWFILSNLSLILLFLFQNECYGDGCYIVLELFIYYIFNIKDVKNYCYTSLDIFTIKEAILLLSWIFTSIMLFYTAKKEIES